MVFQGKYVIPKSVGGNLEKMKNESFTFSPILQWLQKELFVISYQARETRNPIN